MPNIETINLIVSIVGLLFGGGILIGLLKLTYYVGRQTQKLDSLVEIVKHHDDDLHETRLAVVEMQDTFAFLGQPMQRLIQSRSPLAPSELGEELLEKSGFLRLLSDNKRAMVGWVTELKPTTPYDVQSAARRALLLHKNDALFAPLKAYAYEHGEVSLDQLLVVGSLPLRDVVIRELQLKD